MKNFSKLALDLQERDYSVFSLGKVSVWFLSLFCLFCIKIRPKKTTKINSKYTTFPNFITSFLTWILGLRPAISIFYKNLNIEVNKINSDSYLSLPSKGNIIEWE